MHIPAVTVQELYRRIESGASVYLLDVRTDEEYSREHLSFTSDLMSYESVPELLGRLPQNKEAEMYMFCRTGRRSGIVTSYLRELGYTNVFNVAGGIVAWKEAGYGTVLGEAESKG